MRKPRILQKGAKYHVVSKIHRGENIFDSNEFKNIFLDTVQRAKEKYEFTIENFVIMPNHIHFLINPGIGECLSEIMKWILSVFAKKFNKIHNYKGQVWRDRFFSRIIENIIQYIDTFRYISENPVKAGLVKNPWEYKYCGVYQIVKNIKSILF